MADDDKLSERVDDDIAGVQGEQPKARPTADADLADEASETGTEVEAPDAGEIEWAGALVKKAPGSNPQA